MILSNTNDTNSISSHSFWWFPNWIRKISCLARKFGEYIWRKKQLKADTFEFETNTNHLNGNSIFLQTAYRLLGTKLVKSCKTKPKQNAIYYEKKFIRKCVFEFRSIEKKLQIQGLLLYSKTHATNCIYFVVKHFNLSVFTKVMVGIVFLRYWCLRL